MDNAWVLADKMNETKIALPPAGTLVRLRSGGPVMTVYSIPGQLVAAPGYERVVSCEWFVGDDLRRDAFGLAELDMIEGRGNG